MPRQKEIISASKLWYLFSRLFLASDVRLESCVADKSILRSAGDPLFFKMKWFPGNIVA